MHPPTTRVELEPANSETNNVVCGDNALIGQLYAKNSSRIRAWIARRPMLRADADDLMQETFLVALQKADKFRGEGSQEAWLFGIARNVVRHHQRSRCTEKRGGPLSDLPFDDKIGERLSMRPHLSGPLQADWDPADLIQTLVRSTDDPHLDLVTAHYVEGMSVRELAERDACTPAAMKSRLHRARAKIGLRVPPDLGAPL